MNHFDSKILNSIDKVRIQIELSIQNQFDFKTNCIVLPIQVLIRYLNTQLCTNHRVKK